MKARTVSGEIVEETYLQALRLPEQHYRRQHRAEPPVLLRVGPPHRGRLLVGNDACVSKEKFSREDN